MLALEQGKVGCLGQGEGKAKDRDHGDIGVEGARLQGDRNSTGVGNSSCLTTHHLIVNSKTRGFPLHVKREKKTSSCNQVNTVSINVFSR